MKKLIMMLCLLFLFNASGKLNAQQADRHLVMDYLQNQQYDDAIAYLSPITDSNNVNQESLLAYTFYQAGRTTDAHAHYLRVIAIDSSHISARQYLATIYMQQDQPLSAIAHYQKIVELKPQNATAWKQLGMAGFIAHMPDSAFVWLSKSYDLNPSDARVVARLAEEWIERKRTGMADTMLKTYLMKDSSNALVLATAARTSYLLKDYKRTLSIGDKLKQMNIASPNTFLYIVAAAYYLFRYEACISTYEYLSMHNANSESITYYTAMAYTQLKKYKESNGLLQICIDMAKSVSLDNYYSAKAINYEALKLYKPAIASLDTAYYMFHQPLKQYSIGRIYDAHLKNEVVATRYYKRYMQLYKGETREEREIYDYLKSRFGK
ncbi:tetratricopeptide repeat protein [Chitinophaga rhizophila]|uniref:Tetratricopeptide repeat protein n=1 Tax=Chitinophaga rhizophila TaxID=2866212 RepID=A0ABS7GBA1_9BACT|nr:tetratricopeptide repeat protein [Chitinophaga rhizophila]MBW8684939.1 tetratricopeptide repeat protein [Chitinophaga rhizophila]